MEKFLGKLFLAAQQQEILVCYSSFFYRYIVCGELFCLPVNCSYILTVEKDIEYTAGNL